MKRPDVNRWAGIYCLPGLMMLSVLIGGGFATGREIVEYGARYGRAGWLGGIGICLGFTLIGFFTFELARRNQTYDYRSFLRAIIGRAWVAFDICFIALAILIIAVMAAATGDILQQTLGVPASLGMAALVVLVGLINGLGYQAIERFKSFGTVVLFLSYSYFAVLVTSQNWSVLTTNLSLAATSTDAVSGWRVLWSGLLYVGYNLAIFPAAMGCLRRQSKLKHSIGASLLFGVFTAIPWFLTYFSLLAFYPSENVFSASVPWLQMLGDQSVWVIMIFGLVVGWTLIATAVGVVHALMERIDNQLVEYQRKPLSSRRKSLLAVALLLVSLAFSQMGVIALIAKGYKVMAYAMMLVYALPVLVVGCYRLIKKPHDDGVTISS